MFESLHRLYGAQSHLIDGGRAREWAATFTPDGEFRSPTYPRPVAGTAELTAFAERFFADARAAGVTVRHVLTNVFAERTDERTALVHAYLQIVSTPDGGEPHIDRMTVVTDDLVRVDGPDGPDGPEGGRWLIARRTVHRDGAPDPAAEHSDVPYDTKEQQR